MYAYVGCGLGMDQRKLTIRLIKFLCVGFGSGYLGI